MTSALITKTTHNMSKIKIVSIDIDGTLLNDQREITQEVKSSIQQALENDVKIVITTGRPLPGVRDILSELGIQGSDQYVITYNGGLVQTADGEKTLFRQPLGVKAFQEVNNFMRTQDTYVQVETHDAAYTTNHRIHPWASFENSLVNLPLFVLDTENELEKVEFIKAIANAESSELDKVQAAIPNEISNHVNVIRSTANNLEFIDRQASKGNALLALADVLDIEHVQTMAIGDQANDYSMIEQAGVGVAMGNAIPELKAIADYETATNNHSGVAQAIKTFVLD
ncbi:hydrolase, haloacid dehalogenase-like family protein [Leuconostoc sp. C2]|uniref:Hydrolase, haloacid dehalogenase-like family n=2 Tax=Leuconostoc kimchii TaxID=136609 RepID=D5T2E4_LEUKI|nr:hydrolase, haloacid dehalogenase-like family [Leuconostoc kimchii IMSNU 11154]AEJ31632.1 hydrolase, haloacid dehalogenase-like family protein [Leuconostoc sp. C2]